MSILTVIKDLIQKKKTVELSILHHLNNLDNNFIYTQKITKNPLEN